MSIKNFTAVGRSFDGLSRKQTPLIEHHLGTHFRHSDQCQKAEPLAADVQSGRHASGDSAALKDVIETDSARNFHQHLLKFLVTAVILGVEKIRCAKSFAFNCWDDRCNRLY